MVETSFDGVEVAAHPSPGQDYGSHLASPPVGSKLNMRRRTHRVTFGIAGESFETSVCTTDYLLKHHVPHILRAVLSTEQQLGLFLGKTETVDIQCIII